jgi:hypothetical protein
MRAGQVVADGVIGMVSGHMGSEVRAVVTSKVYKREESATVAEQVIGSP